jgi:hypothetical protein
MVWLCLSLPVPLNMSKSLFKPPGGRAPSCEALHAIANVRWARVFATGQTIHWQEAQAYLDARARGERVMRPVARQR